MKKVLDKPYEKDEFFKKWLVGLSERTKRNNSNDFHDWHIFIGMTPDGADKETYARLND
jgi:hypothetical protein